MVKASLLNFFNTLIFYLSFLGFMKSITLEQNEEHKRGIKKCTMAPKVPGNNIKWASSSVATCNGLPSTSWRAGSILASLHTSDIVVDGWKPNAGTDKDMLHTKRFTRWTGFNSYRGYVYACIFIAKWLEHQPRFNSHFCHLVVVVSLSKNLYSHCSSLPPAVVGTSGCFSGSLLWCWKHGINYNTFLFC